MRNPLTQKLPLYPAKPLLLPGIALKSVTSKSGKGVYASNDVLFKGAIFGRDSIEVAEDLLALKPRLVRRIILTLAGLQGEIKNDTNEEEPGKIIHEYRTAIVDGKPLRGSQKHIFEELGARWGGDDQELAYYGSVDATPHFLRLLGAYTRKYGTKIMDSRIRLRSGHTLSLQLIMDYAADWVCTKLDDAESGMIEYHRANPQGIENQVWKDSREFYVHNTGERANHEAPIASIEVQGLAYDALLAAAELTKSADKRDVFAERARELRTQILRKLWLPEKNYFALGVDYSSSGEQRTIQTITANPAALLDTALFDELPDEEKQLYVAGIVKKVMSPDFLTDAGIRSRALSEGHLVDYWDYHGSYVTWPKETYDIAKGFRRQGFPALAKQLENRLLNMVLRSGSYPEFVYVDEWGRVLASAPESHEHGDFIIVDSTNNPETTQAWTVSALYAIVANLLSSKLKRSAAIEQTSWQIKLEKEILRHIPHVDMLLSPWALAAKYPKYPYRVVKGKSSDSTDMPGR